MVALHEPKTYSKIILGIAMLNIVLYAIFIPKFDIIGAAIITSAGYLLMMILSFMTLKKKLEINFPWYNSLKSIIAGLVFLLSITYLKPFFAWPGSSMYLGIILTISIASLIFLVSIFLLRIVHIKELKTFMKPWINNKKEI